MMQDEFHCLCRDDQRIEGTLSLPDPCFGLIILAYSSCRRLKPTTDYVASVLGDAGLGTLRIDLCGPNDTQSHQLTSDSDIALLAACLGTVVDRLRRDPRTRDLPLGVLGAMRCACAALELAADRHVFCAIVSRGCRADLTKRPLLARVSAPTMMIVGDLDETPLRVSRRAYAALRCEKRLEVIPGANQDFKEPGNTEVVARLARSWFLQHTLAVRCTPGKSLACQGEDRVCR